MGWQELKRPMKLSKKLKRSTLGVALLCVAAGSSALTLGRARGAALLGQPLQVTVPVQIAPGEDASTLCFDADVFYGDTKLNPSQVKVVSDTAAAVQSPTVKVSVATPVDEPVVTVYLRAGCGVQVTRRYVLLADLASEVTPLAQTLPAQVALRPDPSPARTPVLPNAATAQAEVRSPAAAPDGKADHAPAVKRPPEPLADNAVPKGPAPSAKAARMAKAPTGRASRLTLAPLDLALEHDPALKISNVLLTVPVEDLGKRAEAAALWRALNASPQDVLRDAARLQAMESDLKLQQEQAAKNRQAIATLASRLEVVESQRYANPLVYGLLALLAAGGAGLVFLWSRLRSTGAGSTPWWRGTTVSDEADLPDLDAPAVALPRANTPEAVPEDAQETLGPLPGLTEVDIDLQLASSAFADLGLPAPGAQGGAVSASAPQAVSSHHRDFEPSVTRSLREINTREMLDVRQQADFFMTLGQHDQAVAVLENCIRDSADANPLVYLDLLSALHTLSRKAEYDRYRDRFNTHFTGQVPAYAEFHHSGKGLDAYADLCAQIAALWPSVNALDFIEHCLVRPAGGGPAQAFDLEAFRDLLMLHAVVQRLLSDSDSGLLPFSTHKVDDTPWAAGAAPDLQADASSQGAGGLAVDLDLSEPVGNLIEFDTSGFSAAPPAPNRNAP